MPTKFGVRAPVDVNAQKHFFFICVRKGIEEVADTEEKWQTEKRKEE